MLDLLRYILVEYSPLLKRFFSSTPFIYTLLSFIPILGIPSKNFNTYKLLVFIFSSTVLYFWLSRDYFIHYIPILMLFCFSSVWMMKSDFFRVYEKLLPFFIISCVYGLFQKFFGYLPFERAWMASSVGTVGEINFLFMDDIRPFSFYAGIPEFALACSFFIFFFLEKRRFIASTLVFFMLLLIGSRGVIVATSISIFVVYYRGISSIRLKCILSIIMGLMVYFIISYIYPIYAPQILSFFMLDDSSRLAVYGTFNARLLSLSHFFTYFNSSEFYLGGLHIQQEIRAMNLSIDNFYLRMVNDFGFIALITIIFYLLIVIKNTKQLYVVSLFLTYGFYSDIFPSLFAMFLFLHAFYANQDFINVNNK